MNFFCEFFYTNLPTNQLAVATPIDDVKAFTNLPAGNSIKDREAAIQKIFDDLQYTNTKCLKTPRKFLTNASGVSATRGRARRRRDKENSDP